MSPNASVFQEWRTADRQALALEQALTKASLGALDGRNSPPSPQEHERAKAMRHVADDLFQVAMAEMKARADEARHQLSRGIQPR